LSVCSEDRLPAEIVTNPGKSLIASYSAKSGFSAQLIHLPHRLILTILAPLFFAKLKAPMAAKLDIEPPFHKLIFIIFAWGLIHTVPRKLFVSAQMIPATWVPCDQIAATLVPR
jgi:hypothetical protein